ncbi:MAG TPA: copper chaperone PCu(A)C [Alphaproteobacteria bacterium]|nr:copper chaperone PCu(A)C [Alphaproteobacteria bacterium]
MKKLLLLLLLMPLAAHAATPKAAKTKPVSATTPVSQTTSAPLVGSQPPPLRILDASIPAAAAGQSAAVSMMLINPTSSTIVIRGATSPAAQIIRLQHITKTPEGLMQMETQSKLIIPAGSNAVLSPGATELRLLNLTYALEAGFETPLTLIFNDGTTKNIRLHIKD